MVVWCVVMCVCEVWCYMHMYNVYACGVVWCVHVHVWWCLGYGGMLCIAVWCVWWCGVVAYMYMYM